MLSYVTTYKQWESNPEQFWLSASEKISWYHKPQKNPEINENKTVNWFPDGTTNICYNAIDRHIIASRGEETAIIYDSPLAGIKEKISYNQLSQKVTDIAKLLIHYQITKGDTVIIYMPPIPEAVASMLACARIGAVHSVVFGGFSAKELTTRINDCKPKIILSATCGIEPNKIINYLDILKMSREIATFKPQHYLIWQRKQLELNLNEDYFLDWQKKLEEIQSNNLPIPDCEIMKSTDPSYILYTSGVTGKPKGVVRDTGGHITALAWAMDAIYNTKAGDVFWAASDIGWVVGHSYVVYSPLLVGASTILFEGKPVATPNASAFWRVISEYKVKIFLALPTTIRTIKKEDPNLQHLKNYDVSSLKALFLTGEKTDTDTIKWMEENLNVPVIDHWWQTETGWAICSNTLGLGLFEKKIGSAGLPMPGYKVKVLDNSGKLAKPNELGNLVIKLPLPPSCLNTLWNNQEAFQQSYLDDFPGYYSTSDAGHIDEDGYIYIMSRADDIINVAGHKLSTGGIENVVAKNKNVAENMIIGYADKLNGEVPVCFFVLKNNSEPEDLVKNQIKKDVRNSIGAIASIKYAIEVKKLPKTRSGKILRATVKKIIDKSEWAMPSTIEDPLALANIEKTFAEKIKNQK